MINQSNRPRGEEKWVAAGGEGLAPTATFWLRYLVNRNFAM